MISDTLFEANEEIRRYLSDPAFAKTYEGEMRKRINRLLVEMDAIRADLDTPPKLPKVNERQKAVLLYLKEDDEAEAYSPLHNIAVNLNWSKNDVRLVARQLARKGLAVRVAFHDDDGYIRGSGYGITAAGKKIAAEIGGTA